MQVFVIFLIAGICKGSISYDVEKRWCSRNETTNQKIVTQERIDREVGCLDLYRFIQDGWKYDEKKMREFHGDQESIESYFQHEPVKALCRVYLPKKVKKINVTNVIMECCPGWTGLYCQKKMEHLGRCYYNNMCQNTPAPFSSAQFISTHNQGSFQNRNDISVRACCLLLKGVTWKKSTISENEKATDHSCIQCDDMTKKTVKHFEARKRTVCAAWNENYLFTLESTPKIIPTGCAYRMIEAADATWWIDIENDACNDTGPCGKKLRINFGEDAVITMIGDKIFVNQRKLSDKAKVLPKGIVLKQMDGFVIVESSVGVSLKWNKNSVVIVTLDENIDVSNTKGVCRMQEANDVFEPWISEGIYPPHSTTNQHLEHLRTNYCHNRVTDDVCNDISGRFNQACRFILEDKLFEKCRKILSPHPFYKSCIQSSCRYGTNLDDIKSNQSSVFLCESAIAYMMICVAHGIKLTHWMEKYNCSWQCPAGLIFVECATKCPLSCEFPNEDQSSYCMDDCVPGCQCPKGEVLKYGGVNEPESIMNGDNCVQPGECPCKHRNSFYKFGEKMTLDCNECVCGERGAWKCSSNHCQGICHVISATHVITFDNSKIFIEKSPCPRNILMKTLQPVFRFIEVEMELKSFEQDGNSELQSIRNLKVTIGKDAIKLKKSMMKIELNGLEAALPFRNKLFTVRHASTHTFFVQSFGFLLIWIPTSDMIRLVLDPIYSDKIIGICGTYNWNPKDDQMTPDGDIELLSSIFVRKFQQNESGEDCFSSQSLYLLNGDQGSTFADAAASSHPCATHTQRRHHAQQTCNLLLKIDFQPCSFFVDPQFYEAACLHDLCSSTDFTKKPACRTLSAYAFSCLQFANDSSIISKLLLWRQNKELNGECDLYCPPNLHFSECLPLASTMCSDLNRPLPSYHNVTLSRGTDHKVRCFPGCACLKGKRLTETRSLEFTETSVSSQLMTAGTKRFDVFGNTLTCVNEMHCPCYNGGNVFAAKSQIKTGCISCECSSGRWNCSSKACGATVRCPNNMIFSRNVTPCDQKTCDNANHVALLQDKGECENEFSFESCICPNGLLQQGEECISAEECPCRHGGKMFYKGERMSRDCNTCTCKRSLWHCTNTLCSGVCVVTGDSHYITFDGQKYSFQGSCTYILVRERNALFQVSAENVPCGLTGVTCTKSVYINVGATFVHLLRGKRVTVNGAKVGRLPRHYGSHFTTDDVNVLSIDLAGIYVVVSWPKIGLFVFWDGGTRVQIQLSPLHKGRVSGLCGNYDQMTTNEFATQQGSVETILFDFVNSWKTSSVCFETIAAQELPDFNPCETNLHRAVWGRRKCLIISRGRIFSECRNIVPYETYYAWCVHDACACDSGGDCECLCTAIAAYNQACNHQHVFVEWRSQDLCPMQCDNGMVYMACGPVCQETCFNSSRPDYENCEVLSNNYQVHAASFLQSHCSALSCVEGCFCPPGMVMHEQRCVTRSECPCFLENGEYSAGALLQKDCQYCTCVNGAWDCEGKPCASLLPSCGTDKFLCGDGVTCISSLWKCDFENDCIDGSDEIGCDWTTSECILMGGHVCGSGKCLLFSKKCNGETDCEDGTDEVNCTDVGYNNSYTSDCNSFSCSSGKCIPESMVCDGNLDCGFGDYSDEQRCHGNCLYLSQYSCGGGVCISRRAYCDGTPDCRNGSDEVGCVCTPTYYTCLDGLCIDRALVCDGEPDCSQGEDELDCDEFSSVSLEPSSFLDAKSSNCTEFHCNSDVDKCIPWPSVCDGLADCPDRSDESKRCWTPCIENKFSCDRGMTCVDEGLLCDGVTQCRDGSDESNLTCSESSLALISLCARGFQCDNGSCINGSLVCDELNHCLHGEDEVRCQGVPIVTAATQATLTLQAGNISCAGFTCLDGKCIELNQVCNGINECLLDESAMQSSDEEGCATWNAWKTWGDCSRTCGSGLQLRNRTCIHKPHNKEYNDSLKTTCKGKSYETQPCFRMACHNRTIGLTPWSRWSLCSVTCGGGLTTRWRLCTDGTHTCSVALYGGRYQSPLPLVEIKSCLPEVCPNKQCVGDKKFYSCNGKDRNGIKECPLTCRDVALGGVAMCVASSSGCQPGCHCPHGFVTINETSKRCLPINDCPCFYKGKMYNRGEEVTKKESCERCQCSLAGRWKGCIDDTLCDSSRLCEWTTWSNWGPCFGPCSVNGIQWSFRSPIMPTRYGSSRRCKGIYRKSRRCPTARCVTCDVTESRGSTTSRNAGEQWKQEPCHVCMCRENRTVTCQKHCDLSTVNCSNNGTLIEPKDESSCCYCQSSNFSSGPAVNSITSVPSSVEEYRIIQNTKSTTASFADGNGQFSSVGYDSNTSADVGNMNGTTKTCKMYQCSATGKCIDSKAMCNGIFDCPDKSDEDTEICRHYNVGSAKVGCFYAPWSDWSICSQSCGLGKQTRHRGVKKHTGFYTVEESCEDGFQVFQTCFIASCEQNGSWSSWQTWSQCSLTCGGGAQFRRRNCDSPPPLNGGRECFGASLETKVCNALPCTARLCSGGRIYVSKTECSELRLCAQTCEDLSDNVNCKTSCKAIYIGGCFCPNGTFLQDDRCVSEDHCRCIATHTIYNPYSTFTLNGCECSCKNGKIECSFDCAGACTWSEWSKWSPCDRTCGIRGRTHRYRSPVVLGRVNSTAVTCNGVHQGTKMCPYIPCPAMWTTWSAWSQCSSSCGIGTQSRKRQCSIDGQTVEQRLCEEFDELSRHHQYRVCKNPRSDRLCSSCPNGMSYECVKCAFTCSDVSARREICTEKCTWTCSCPDSRYTQNNSCVTLEKCSCETGDKSNLSTTKDQLPAGRSRNIDCNTCTCTMGKLICTENICPGKSTTVWEWSPWSRWSPCSHTCLDTNNLSLKLQGSKRRYRECFSKQNKLAPVQSGKNWCEDLSEQAVQCGLELCPTLSTWSSWSKWSTCDRSCGGGIQACKRICKKSQALNPGACSGPTDKVRACMLPPCDGQRCPIGSSVKYGCNNSCSNGPTCFQLSSETEGPEICNVTGNYSQEYCQCNKGLLWQGGKCIPQDKCSCYAFKRTRLAGAKFNIGECTTCTCNGGKTTCAPKMNANGNLTCDPNQPCFDETDDIVIWSTWTSCSKSCDVGVRRRFSTSTIGQIYIGAWCRHRGEQQEDCSVLSCVKNENNCTGHPDLCKGGPNEEQNGWGSWSPWGSCSTTCLEKNFTSWRHRYRTCYSVTSSSDICTGTASQSSVCDGTLIPTCDRYASWSLWSHWSECSVTCSPRLWSSEAAYKIKTRICEGGGKCTGSPVETKLCATSSILTPCLNSSAVPFDDDTCHQVVAGSRYSECGPRCTKTCSGATICSVRCNSGCFCPDGYALERNLSCVPLSQCKCYDANVKRYFNSGEVFLKTEPCQRTCRCVNGAISCEGCAIESNWCRWSHWTACSKTCGKQERFRYRPTSSSSGDSTLELSTSTDALIGVDRMKIEIAKDVCKISSTCGRGTEYATVWGAWDGWAKCDCTSPYSVRKRSCITAFNSQHHNHRNLSGCPGINVQTKPCRVDLRSCEYNCPNGLVLSPCSLNKCPISCLDLSSKVKCIETNETLNEHSDHESPSTKCFPQCTCPSGLLINPILNKEGFECVSPEECPCFFDNVTNKLSNAGFLSQPNLLKPVYMLANNKYSDRCKNCTCHSDGKLECDFAKSANCSRNVFDEQAWNGWTSWSECSSTCTGGTQWRMRTCIHEINKPCQSAGEQERLCNGDVSCSMTPWETWGSCSRSCRKGIRSRRRHCLPEKKCSGDDLKELSQCQDQLSCPPTLTQWTTWTQCSVKCGIGEKIRHRWCRNSTHDLQIHHCTATEMPKDVSKLLKTESSICFGKTCSINSTTKLLSWGLWGSWSSCNGTCGVGRQKKTRLCPSHSNSFQEDSTSTSCSGKREIMRNCELPPCPNKSRTSPCPVGTKLSNICDHCQRGSNGLARRLPKTCSEVASGLSTPCDLNVCGQICLCDEDKVMQLHGSTTASCVSANNCECIDNTGIVWPPGAAWNIIEEKRNQNCKTCSCSFGQIACHNKRCMRSDVCKWSMWGRWTPCDQTCHGTETAKRSRFRTSRTSSEESECKAGRLQVKICKQLRRCPNNCSDGDVSQKTWWKDDCVLCSCDIEGKRVCNNTCWSSWSAWTPCSATCGLDAHQHRTRKCLSQTSACDDANSSENKLCDDIVMTSCPNEEQNKESAFTCSIHSDRVVFSLDGCTSRDTEIHHCSGYCPSSVRVLSHEPYIHSTCFCCQQHLDDVLPYSTVTLYCPDQSQRVITVPNIASCSCHACDGNPRARK